MPANALEPQREPDTLDSGEEPDQTDGVVDQDPSSLEAATVADAIRKADPSWESGESLEIAGKTWRPHLVRKDARALLYVHLSDRLRSFARTRLDAAFKAGLTVHVAIPESRLFDEDLLIVLASLDAHVHVIDSGGKPEESERLLALLADRQVTVTNPTRVRIASGYLELCRKSADSNTKGRRFEALLAFLFSQISDFIVRERNFRTATEEIDIVVQQRATQGRAWATLMAPFILVEGKNHASGVSQEMTSTFLVKMQGKRGNVRLGFLCSATTVSGEALAQELRFAATNTTIVFLDYEALKAWCTATDSEEHLEDVVSRAMLR